MPEGIMNGKEWNEKGTEHLLAKQYDDAMECFMKAEGNYFAMYNLACMHYFGDGTERDPDQALGWFIKASEAGDAEAASRAGTLLSGKEVSNPDARKAYACFLSAAERGSLSGMGNLAMCLLEGRGCEKDIETGLQWMEKASRLGNGIASLKLGGFAEEGIYLEKDPAKAAEYYRRGVQQKYAPAAERLAALYELGKGVPKDPAYAAELRKDAETMTED